MNMTIADLEKKARILRLNIIKMVGVGQKGHLGGSCSLAEDLQINDLNLQKGLVQLSLLTAKKMIP